MILIIDENVLWTKYIIFLIFSIICYIIFLNQILNTLCNSNCKYTEGLRRSPMEAKIQLTSVDDKQYLMIVASSLKSGFSLDYSRITHNTGISG